MKEDVSLTYDCWESFQELDTLYTYKIFSKITSDIKKNSYLLQLTQLKYPQTFPYLNIIGNPFDFRNLYYNTQIHLEQTLIINK